MTDDLGNDLPQAPAYNPPAPDPSTGGRLASFGKGLLSTFSGGATSPSYSVDPNTGATVTTQTPNSTGQMFRNLFAGMLSGFAGGVQANANGAHGAAGAFAGGVTADAQRREKIDQQQRSQAQQQFGDQQTASMNKAHMAQMTQEAAASAFEMARKNVEIQTGDADKFNNLQQTISQTPGASKIGTYKDFPTFLSSMDADGQKDIIAKQAAGEIALHPVLSFDGGVPKVVGVDVYHIPQSYLNKPTDRPIQVGLEHNVDPKTGIDSPKPVIAPPGSITNKEAIGLNQQNLKDVISQKDLFEAKNKRDLEIQKDTAAANREDARLDAMIRTAEIRADAQGRANEPLAGADRDKMIAGFGNFRGSISVLRNYIAKHNDPGIVDDIAEKFPGWSEARYQTAQSSMKDLAPGGKDYPNLVAMDTAVQHSASLRDMIKSLPATGNATILNGAINTLSKKFGLPQVTNVEALETALSEELASGYKKGVADVDLQKKIREGLNTYGSRDQLLGVLDTHAHAQYQRAGSVAGSYRANVPNATTDPYGPNFSKGGEQALHSFGLDNPFNYGMGPKPENGGSASLSKAPQYVIDQFMKLAGGDPKKAGDLAHKRGWEQ